MPRPVAAADTRAPRAALFAQTGSGLVRRMARNDLRFRVGCDEPCRVIKATLKSTGSTTKSLRRRGFRRTTLVAQRTAPTGLAALHIVRVKRSTEGHRMLRALNSGRYVLRVVVADAAGNRTVVTRTVTVRR